MTDLKTDILVVGGGPGGFIITVTAATYWPEKKITVVRPEEKSLIPCGIPYIFGTLGGIEEDLFYGSKEFRATGATLLIDRVESVDGRQRLALLKSGKRIRWDRLVISTGAEPIMPPLPGANLEGVFTIHKEYDYMDHFFRKHIPNIQRMVVIGGGFIGVEFAEEIRKHGTEVHLVEMLPHLLLAAFDEDVCIRVENELKHAGVQVHTGTKVESILPDASGKRVAGVRIETGEEITADAVLVAIGVRPRNDLAKNMGLSLGRHGAILVDSFQRTLDDPAIFAVGDCTEKQDFFTRRQGGALLASQAASEGRIAGMNLYGLRLPRFNAGNVAVYISEVGNLGFGAAGLTYFQAEEQGFLLLVGEASVADRYPASMPGTREIYCRLIFSKESLQLLGGQVLGGRTSGELVNAIAIAIQTRATATEIVTFQLGAHPRLTGAEHPLIAATEDALLQRI